MTNREVVTQFFTAYQRHDYNAMNGLLDPSVEFSDMAFPKLTGDSVRVMWRWFCSPTDSRNGKAVEVPHFEIVRDDGDEVQAEYRVQYTLKGRPIDYTISTEMAVRGGRIVWQEDTPTISDYAFARMVGGLLASLLALTPLFRRKLRRTMHDNLAKFAASIDGARAAGV